MKIEPWHIFVGAFCTLAVFGFLARKHLPMPGTGENIESFYEEPQEGELPMQKSPIFKLDY